MNHPLISIILPVYNGEKFLNESIKSCLSQTYSNLELIIINDASTDRSSEIINKWAKIDSRIKIIENKKNLKLPASLNLGHKKAKGRFVTWTSDDNVYDDHAIDCLFKTLMYNDCDIAYSEYLHINEKGELIGQSRLKDIEYLLYYGVIGACFLYRIEVFNRNNGYNEDLFMVEDYDFWLLALKHSKFKKIDNPGIYRYRYHAGSLTNLRLSREIDKKTFNIKLKETYTNIFSRSPHSKLFTQYFLGHNENVQETRLLPLKRSFFRELNVITDDQLNISFLKLKRIIFNDLVDYILHQKNSQKLKTLFYLHKNGFNELLRLPVERYLVLVKKCLF